MGSFHDPYHQHKSRHILGTGIIFAGILILSIGLIFGLEFPNYILRRRQSRVCITSPSSRDFQPWVYNRNRTKRNHIYIWNMTNGHLFVTKGHQPQFKVVGPYVFDEIEVKVGVTFRHGLVQYRPWTRQKFNRDLTTSWCGDHCSENDKVNTFNPEFLQRVSKFPSRFYYHLSLVPVVLANHLRGMPETDVLDFDRWFHTHHNATTQSPVIASYLQLYETLSNGSVFGVGVLRNQRLWNSCEHKFEAVIRSNDTIDHLATEPDCGLVFYLIKLNVTTTKVLVWNTTFKPMLSSLWCQSELPCFLDESPDDVTQIYTKAVAAYVTDYLPSIICHRSTSIVTDISVSRLLLGYWLTTNRSANMIHIAGLLEHQETADQAQQLARQVILHTCLFNRSQMQNLNYEEIVQFHGCTDDVGLRCDRNSWKTNGIQDYKIPPTRNLVPCRQPKIFVDQLLVYVPELMGTSHFVRIGRTSYEGIPLENFRLDPDNDSMISTSDVTGYESWTQMTNTLVESGAPVVPNEIRVEPVSGEIWQRTTNLRYYIGLKPDFLLPNSSVDDLEQPIPYYALHVDVRPSAHMLQTYDAEIGRLLQASCGGLVVMSIAGNLIVVVGVIVGLAIIRRPPSNRVAPQFYVNPHLPKMETGNGLGDSLNSIYS